MTDHRARANDLANRLTLAAPGYLCDALGECSAEELETVAKVVRRMDLIREIKQQEGGLLRG
jgi:hypothetical protein